MVETLKRNVTTACNLEKTQHFKRQDAQGIKSVLSTVNSNVRLHWNRCVYVVRGTHWVGLHAGKDANVVGNVI